MEITEQQITRLKQTFTIIKSDFEDASKNLRHAKQDFFDEKITIFELEEIKEEFTSNKNFLDGFFYACNKLGIKL